MEPRRMITLTRNPIEDLSERQRDVLRHLAHGLTTEETADQMDLSPNTVRLYRNAAYHKLGISGRDRPGYRAAYLYGRFECEGE